MATKGGPDNGQNANGRVTKSKAEMRAESRAATEARLATLRARLTMDAAKILKPGVAKVLMPIVLSAIEAAIRAKLWAKENPTTAITIGAALFSFVIVPILGPAVLGALGFGPGGVILGSWAAAAQAGIGNVVAGSAFALAQSAGATGVIPLAWCVAGGVAGGSGALVVKKTHDLGCWIRDKFRGRSDRTKDE